MSQIKPTVEIIPLKKKLEAGREQTLDVLVRIKSPAGADEAPVERPKLNLCVVLDRSGSMAGSKITEAIQATKTCIDNMLADDTLGCVVFDHSIDVLFPNQNVTDRGTLHRLLEGIMPRGNTALHGAWVRGGLEVTNAFKSGAVNRVLLVTDGQANAGETRPDVISQQARELAARGVSTTTIGIGRDFNEDLLIPMAEAGGGNSWHVKTADDMTRIFDVELNGLVNQFGHSVTMGFRTGPAVEVVDVINEFELAPSGRRILPNLTKANDLDVVVRLKVKESAQGSTDGLFETDLSFIGQSSGLAERVETKFAFEFVSAEEAAQEADNHEAAQASLLLNNARDRREAVRSMDIGDFSRAENRIVTAMSHVEHLFSISPNAELEAELTALRAQLDQMKDQDFVMARKGMTFQSRGRFAGKFAQLEKDK